MDSVRTEQQYSRLLNDVQQWLSLRGEQAKLIVADKVARVLGLVVMSLCVGLLVLVGLVFFGIALAGWLGAYMHPALGYCIVGGVYVLLIVTLIVFRKALIIRPFVTALCAIILEVPDLTPEKLPVKQEQLEQQSLDCEGAIRQDVNNIQQELSTPSTLFTWIGRLPQIVRFIITILPFVQRVLRKRR